MNEYFEKFLHRGFIFSGFGPVVMGIIYFILSYTINDFTLSGIEVFVAIISTYLLAFVHAGSSVFNQIEHWSIAKSMFCQLGILYIAYVTCYLINSWLPFNPMVILIFTAIFVVTYLTIWLIVYLCVKMGAKKLSKKLV